MKINWSRIKQFQACPRFYYWRYVCDFEEKRGTIPLTFGRAIHAGLAAHYAGKPEQVVPDLDEEFDEECAQNLLPQERTELGYHREYAKFVMRKYQQHYGQEPWQILAPEIEGDFQLGKHRFFFRADGAVAIKGQPWLLEHKTTSYLGNTYFKRFTLDGQITVYMYGMKQVTDLKPVGAILNVIRKSKASPMTCEFAREVLTRSWAFIHEFMDSVEQQVDRIAELTEHGDKEDFPMYTDYCYHYGRSCEFAQLCLSDNEAKRRKFIEREPDYVDQG